MSQSQPLLPVLACQVSYYSNRKSSVTGCALEGVLEPLLLPAYPYFLVAKR